MQPYAGGGTQWLAEQHMPMGKLGMSCAHTCIYAPHVTNKHGHTAGCTDLFHNPFPILLCLQRLSLGPKTLQSLGHGLDCLCRQCMCNCSAQVERKGCSDNCYFARLYCLNCILASTLRCCLMTGNQSVPPATVLHPHELRRLVFLQCR